MPPSLPKVYWPHSVPVPEPRLEPLVVVQPWSLSLLWGLRKIRDRLCSQGFLAEQWLTVRRCRLRLHLLATQSFGGPPWKEPAVRLVPPQHSFLPRPRTQPPETERSIWPYLLVSFERHLKRTDFFIDADGY